MLNSILIALALSHAAHAVPPAGQSAPGNAGRVVLLGFDGADARTIERLVAERPAEFPNIKRLMEQGTFAPLESVVPPESPVSWAAINTGQNPAKTGVPGFIRRWIVERPDGKKSDPYPYFGHIGEETRAIETFDDAPIPTWTSGTWAAVAGGGSFALVFLILFALTRGKKLLVALLPAVLVGAAGAWGGTTLRGYLPTSIPKITVNPNQARNLWDFAAEAGVPCVVLDAAQAFGMPAPEGARVLAGLGVPDAKGELGEWCIYTSDPEELGRDRDGRPGRETGTSGFVYRVDERGGSIASRLYGPKNFWLEEKLRTESAALQAELNSSDLGMERGFALQDEKRAVDDELQCVVNDGCTLDLAVTFEGGAARVRIGDEEHVVEEGAWSPFYSIEFQLNPLLSIHALTRVRIVHLREPHFEMLVNVLDIDPRQPPFWQPISCPASFASELAAASGPYETYGWPTLTMPVKDGVVDPALLMEDAEFTEAWRERVTLAALARDDWRFLMSVFSTADRVQHMMYRYFDPEHPQYDAAEAQRSVRFCGEPITYAEAIPATYQQMDRIIGAVAAKLAPEDTLLVCSDHGFQSFRQQVHVNNWLAEKGYLKVETAPDSYSGLAFVDWENTTAYSLGMGFVYLNLKGREPRGKVAREEVDAVLSRLREDFLAATDPQTGARLIERVYVTREIHSGPHLGLEGDLILGFAPPYHCSWSSTSGGLGTTSDANGFKVPAPVVQPNDSPWSGDHTSLALEHVPGLFLSNRKVTIPAQGVRALQLAPTVLSLLGVAVPEEMDLEPLDVAR
jgi:predicted AlkP superfamily phosphohydrolase/phosphomutase